jgi:type IV pilus assembly protein PilB
MDSRARIGQLLEQMGKLSGHDIDEILQEQASSNLGHPRAFGEIALAMGLCEPQDVCIAWVRQLNQGMERIDLAAFGVDAQAVAYMTRELATRFCAIPVRLVGNDLVVALSDPAHAAVFEALRDAMHATPHFVLADAAQIRQMIGRYYPGDTAAA